MRFRKSIKVTKGVKLNLSKGGASFTVGSGLPVSLNVGTKGAYLNWSIPGTGVYDRVRLDKVLKEKLGGVLGFGTAAAEEEEPEEKSAKKTGTKTAAKKSSATKTTAKSTSKKTASAKTETKKEPARPSDEEMNAIAQQIALVNIHRQAIDVSKKASGTLNADEAEAQIEAWLSESEAPIEFSVQPEVIESKGTVMIDLDLPEIEDMPQDKLAELADGTIKIKKKTKRSRWRTTAPASSAWASMWPAMCWPRCRRRRRSSSPHTRSAGARRPASCWTCSSTPSCFPAAILPRIIRTRIRMNSARSCRAASMCSPAA